MSTIIFSRIPDPFDFVLGPLEIKIKGQGQIVLHKHNKIRH